MRYNRQRFTGMNNENGGTTQSVTHSGDSLVNTDTVTASVTNSFGSSLFNELRGQYAKDSEPGHANSADPESIITDVGNFSFTIGRNNFSPRETTITRYQVADAVTYLFGNHTLKGGFDFNRDLILNWFPGLFSGQYTFNSVASYNLGQPIRYIQNFPGVGTSGPYTNPDLSEIALFLQDEFRPTPNLTLNLGVRYDKQGIAQPTVRNPDAQLLAAGIDTSVIPEDTNNVAVRFGFAWTPKGHDGTVVRGGYGMFYGRTPSIMIGTAMSNNGINVQGITFTGAQMPVVPERLPVHSDGRRGAQADDPRVRPELREPARPSGEPRRRARRVERLLARPLLSLREGHAPAALGGHQPRHAFRRQFHGRRRQRLPHHAVRRRPPLLELQPRHRVPEHGGVQLQRHHARAQQALLEQLAGARRVHVRQGPRHEAGRHLGRAGRRRRREAGLRPEELPGRLRRGQRRPAPPPRPLGLLEHSLSPERGGLEQALFGGWSLSGIVTIASGQPYTAILAPLVDINNDGNVQNDRAPGFARNSFNYPTFFSVDPRITKDIPIGPATLQLIAEAFNVFNRSNVERT